MSEPRVVELFDWPSGEAPARPDSAPSASIVIEWENVLLSEMDRCLAMLTELRRQIAAVQAAAKGPVPTVEVLVVHDRGKVDRGVVEAALDRVFRPPLEGCRTRIVTVTGSDYYTLKNLGAGEAAAPIVIFLDSDVVPEADWLASLLDPLRDEAIQVVGGNSYLTTDGLFDKAMALYWFFPLRSDDGGVVPSRHFFANNVAFRREVALRYPFVPIPGTSRGACRMLARRLGEDGVAVVKASGARVSHPPPNGLRHWLMRGLAEGRDDTFYAQQLGPDGLRDAVWRIRASLRASWRAVLSGRHAVGLSPAAVPVALTLATAYAALKLVGAAAGNAAPAWAERHIRLD